MKPQEIAKLILDGHNNRTDNICNIPSFRLELQLNYVGLMAKGAYRNWKIDKNRGRPKVGCFDFKIFRIQDESEKPIDHISIVRNVTNLNNADYIEQIFNGENPSSIKCSASEQILLREMQLAMLEQEINWGNECFQCWTRFPERPRDFLTAYLRRYYTSPFDLTEHTMRAASGTFRTLRPPIKAEWKPYLIPKCSDKTSWLDNQLMQDYIDIAQGMPDNPFYSSTYGI
ncbi:hypothetical protein ACFL5P_00480 [candidate division KSB1 bacterium]